MANKKKVVSKKAVSKKKGKIAYLNSTQISLWVAVAIEAFVLFIGYLIITSV